jgi:hypothetical protein
MGLYDNWKPINSAIQSMYVGNALTERQAAMDKIDTYHIAAKEKIDATKTGLASAITTAQDAETKNELINQYNGVLDQLSGNTNLAYAKDYIDEHSKELVSKAASLVNTAKYQLESDNDIDKAEDWSTRDKNVAKALNASLQQKTVFNPNGTVTSGYRKGISLQKVGDIQKKIQDAIMKVDKIGSSGSIDTETMTQNTKESWNNLGRNPTQVNRIIENLIAEDPEVKTYLETISKLDAFEQTGLMDDESAQRFVAEGKLTDDNLKMYQDGINGGLSPKQALNTTAEMGSLKAHKDNMYVLGQTALGNVGSHTTTTQIPQTVKDANELKQHKAKEEITKSVNKPTNLPIISETSILSSDYSEIADLKAEGDRVQGAMNEATKAKNAYTGSDPAIIERLDDAVKDATNRFNYYDGIFKATADKAAGGENKYNELKAKAYEDIRAELGEHKGISPEIMQNITNVLMMGERVGHTWGLHPDLNLIINGKPVTVKYKDAPELVQKVTMIQQGHTDPLSDMLSKPNPFGLRTKMNKDHIGAVSPNVAKYLSINDGTDKDLKEAYEKTKYRTTPSIGLNPGIPAHELIIKDIETNIENLSFTDGFGNPKTGTIGQDIGTGLKGKSLKLGAMNLLPKENMVTIDVNDATTGTLAKRVMVKIPQGYQHLNTIMGKSPDTEALESIAKRKESGENYSAVAPLSMDRKGHPFTATMGNKTINVTLVPDSEHKTFTLREGGKNGKPFKLKDSDKFNYPMEDWDVMITKFTHN